MNSRDVIGVLKANGWYEVGHEGSHKQFKHAQIAGRVTNLSPKGTSRLGH